MHLVHTLPVNMTSVFKKNVGAWVCGIAHFLWFSTRFSLRFIISNGLKDHCFPRRKRRHCFDKFTSTRYVCRFFGVFFYRNWLQFTHVWLERNLRNLKHDVASYQIKNKRIILMFRTVIDALLRFQYVKFYSSSYNY